MRIAFLTDQPQKIALVYGEERRARLAGLAELLPGVVTSATLAERRDELADVEAVFATWGMPRLGDEELALLPRLRAVFYAASSVKRFAGPLLERGITVCSAWSANAVPVAEFALAQILLGLKGYFRSSSAYHEPGGRVQHHAGPGAYGATVALLGYGQVARHLRRFLRQHELRVLVVDPHLSPEEAANEEVERVELAEAFRRAQVVSNHLPMLPATTSLIDAAVLELLPPGAVFINTGRGATVDEAALIDLLRRREDLTALLDVTHPEPPLAGSPLYELPNVHLSPHIAGSINDECRRMADWLIEEFLRWRSGEALRYAIDAQRLAIMA